MKPGWEVKKLGDVCSLITRGIAPKYIESGGICVLNQKCVRDHSISFDLARRNNPEQKKVPDERLIQIGDVLVNSTGTGTLGRVAQVLETPTEATTIDTHVTIVRPLKDLFYPAFFGYMLIQIEDELIAAGQGTSGQTELPKKDLENKFKVSYPTDIEQQKRIVSILDKAFEGLNRAQENAEANLKSAGELFDANLGSEFNSDNHMENKSPRLWPLKALGDISYVKSGGTPSKSRKEYWSGSIPWYSSGELNNRFTKAPNKFITEEGLAGSNAKIFPTGSLLIGMYDTAAMKMSILDRDASFNQAIAGVMPGPHFSIEFLQLVLKWMKPRLMHERRGTRQKNLSLIKIKGIQVPQPPLEEQERLVSKLNSMEDNCEIIKHQYNIKLQSISDLRQSLLQKAFAGELT